MNLTNLIKFWEALTVLTDCRDPDKMLGEELIRFAELTGVDRPDLLASNFWRKLLNVKQEPYCLTESIWQCVLSACYLRYMDALKLDDNFASDVSRTAWNVVSSYSTGPELDYMHKLYEEGES